uniref:Uncharacterized protein n=1 Tax=Physcomitrium patens TaxID=3218 RepID=A0A2K1JVR0_PHYPA|nr:hypothetical protein PHYPA_015381 [Physcomitrium patens]
MKAGHQSVPIPSTTGPDPEHRQARQVQSCFACPHHNLCVLLLPRYLFFSCCDFVLSLVRVVPPQQSLEDISVFRGGLKSGSDQSGGVLC